ncbi:methylated-DNA--[protein]-cysteine S-methyltransferase [Wukongibacter baidiensis]|uniref:methylated-DNA--[protein]-cysteine S-methyltransferase n=1 Tax=Wukongibacter baidiensis TaxID=1723361 RepID=UPI003D7FC820
MIKRYYAYYDSPIGLLEIISTEDSLVSIMFVDKKETTTKKPKVIEETCKQLEEYFNGKRKTFDLKLMLRGTEFQNKVWHELTKIPCGKVITYKDMSKRIGNEKAVRAVGNANGKNVINIVVPCHRLIGSNGKLTGYGGGLWRKKWLLEHEGAVVSKK